jgi:hypothetical protein
MTQDIRLNKRENRTIENIEQRGLNAIAPLKKIISLTKTYLQREDIAQGEY